MLKSRKLSLPSPLTVDASAGTQWHNTLLLIFQLSDQINYLTRRNHTICQEKKAGCAILLKKQQQDFMLFRRSCLRQAQRHAKRQKARSVAETLNMRSYLSYFMVAPFVHNPLHIQGKSGIDVGPFSRNHYGWCPEGDI
jgi:hypothetical protein